jgi:hypothetical protein
VAITLFGNQSRLQKAFVSSLIASRKIRSETPPEVCGSLTFLKRQTSLLMFQVFDYDWGLQDDFMGSAYLDLTKFELGK